MLYLFDLDKTLVSGYMDAADRNYHAWQLLPVRRERLRDLVERGHQVGIVTNQAGVAWGYISEGDVRYKLNQVAAALGFDGVTIHDGGVTHRTHAGELPVWVCYDDARARDRRYQLGAGRRKPSGAMIREAADAYPEQAAHGVLFVGDSEEDLQAAQNAGVSFQWAHLFFEEATFRTVTP